MSGVGMTIDIDLGEPLECIGAIERVAEHWSRERCEAFLSEFRRRHDEFMDYEFSDGRLEVRPTPVFFEFLRENGVGEVQP